MTDKIINYLIWLMMSMMFGYFAFTKGWIFNDFENISTQEAKYLIENDKNLIIIDVRSHLEYQKDFIPRAINISASKLKNNLEDINRFKSQKILLYSERGVRSIEISRLLSSKGFTILNLNGGMVFWIRRGYAISNI